MAVEALTRDHLDHIVDVMSDAFTGYPVMRYTLGDAEPRERRHRRLVELFVGGRAWRGDPMFGIRDEAGTMVAAATTTRPHPVDPPAGFLELREQIWTELGEDARARYEEFAAATREFPVAEPHYHLNMIGVRRSHHGRRLGRALLEAVHEMSAREPESSGVTLTTELPANVEMYRRFGYEVVREVQVGPGLRTWLMWRKEKGVRI